MVVRRLIAPHIDFGALRRELKLPTQFSLAAQRDADRAAAAPPPEMPDRTDIEFVTIDPAGSMDLDQAMCLSRRAGGGYRVRYAIADVTSFVPSGSALEAETWTRGQTIYLPDGRIPLHPVTLSEGAASLLPDRTRPAVIWTVDLDADGATGAVHVERGLVRSRAQLTYAGVAAGPMPEPVEVLPEIGKLLIDRGLDRGAINLPIPAQEVEQVDGGWRLRYVTPSPIEDFNAQISLLAGMCAARIMLDGRIGLLRTMPAPDARAVGRLRAAARSLHVDWPDGVSPGRVIAAVNGADPRGAAFLGHAPDLMRGAGYTAFDGEVPAAPEHGGVAAAYAHVTAPLRRLSDRYATEVCLALVAGREVPDGVCDALPRLPEVMASTGHLASAADRGAIDLAEAVLLSGRVGEEFDAAVLDVDEEKPGHERRGVIAIDEPAIRARCRGAGLILGERVRVRLVSADPVTRTVAFGTV